MAKREIAWSQRTEGRSSLDVDAKPLGGFGMPDYGATLAASVQQIPL